MSPNFSSELVGWAFVLVVFLTAFLLLEWIFYGRRGRSSRPAWLDAFDQAKDER